MLFSLECQEHEGRGSWNRLGEASKNTEIAVIDAAVVVGAIEQQAKSFIDARMTSKAGPSQGQARPGRRLDPGEIVLGPGPTDQTKVNVMHFGCGGIIRNSTAVFQQAVRRCLYGFIRFTKSRLNE